MTIEWGSITIVPLHGNDYRSIELLGYNLNPFDSFGERVVVVGDGKLVTKLICGTHYGNGVGGTAHINAN
jgi:hypothetical protein